MTVLFWLLVVLSATALVASLLVRLSSGGSRQEEVGLAAARNRLQATQARTELHRIATRLRRDLNRELGNLDRQEAKR